MSSQTHSSFISYLTGRDWLFVEYGGIFDWMAEHPKDEDSIWDNVQGPCGYPEPDRAPLL